MKRNKNRKWGFLGNPLGLRQTSSRSLPKSSAAVFKFRRRKFVFTWKKLLVSLGVLVGVFVLTTTAVFAYYVRDLPNPKRLGNRAIAQATQIYDRNGKNLYNIHGEENRTIIKGEDISEHVKQATIAVEDANFYNHHGFDAKGILRAARNRFTKSGLGGGGSTITQQYIKNALLTSNQTLDRKLRELILAIEVEQIYTKDEILAGYLNEIPYGSNAYGIEAAAEIYFGKTAKELTLSEAATLAAIPQAPTYYSPYGNHLDDLFIRKDYVLDRMVKTGFISEAEAEKAKGEAPNAENPNFRAQRDLLSPHFVFYVREKLIDTLSDDPQEAEKLLDQGGYKVTTSLDLDTQNMAESILGEMGPEAVKKWQASNGALVAVDPKTGEILAMVGSIDYNKSKSGNTNFANAPLQPGSSFKPIVYATAFQPGHNFSPASITYDVPTDFGNYKPLNYNKRFHGPITNRSALAGSLNIPAVKNLYLAGVKDSIDTAKALGITTLNRPLNEYGLSLVLGSGEVRPVELAGAYAGFANGGMHNPLRPILKIEKDGKIFKDFTTTPAQKAVEPEVAYQINNILSDNSARSFVFGSRNNLTLGADRPVAAKSGSTQNNRDAWTVGYTPSIAVAVWVGNNEANKTMANGADGSIVAGPIWNRFMREYLKGKPVEQFNRPDTIKTLTVDRLSGKLPSDQSPSDQRVTDIFAPWQVPKDFDDVHVKVRISKSTGKLATELTPAEDIEEQIFCRVRSEVPDNPNWENPVQEWARANGCSGQPPTEKDDVHTETNRPTVSITSPTNNSTVSGTFTIDALPGGTQPITKVEFFIDNASIGTRTSAPWSMQYNANDLSSGSHMIQVTATNQVGLTASTQVTVSRSSVIAPTSNPGTDSTPPGNVSNANAVKVMPDRIRLSWTNPIDADLKSVNIYQSTNQDNSSLGSRVQTVSVTPGSNSSIEIPAALLPGVNYFFVFRPVDSSGNENQSTTKVIAH